MPLQDTDVTLVSRGTTNANASMTQVKDYVLGGLTSSKALMWVNYPATDDEQVSSPKNDYSEITSIQFGSGVILPYNDDDVVVLTNLARGSAGSFKVTGRNNSTNSITVEYIAHGGLTEELLAGDRLTITNLGPDVNTDQGNVVIINETTPSGSNGDLWFQPSTGTLSIYNGEWVRVSSDYGPFFWNAVDDLNIDNTGNRPCSDAIVDACEKMFGNKIGEETINGVKRDILARTGCLYFPAGTYRLDKEALVDVQGNRDRASFTIIGDGPATKFYVYNDDGGLSFKFFHKDNYLTVRDLAIHPKQVVNGTGLFMQNGPDDEAADPPDVEPDDNDYIDSLPSGGSNQQYGCQVINVNVLSDDNKPNNQYKKSIENFFKEPMKIINFGRPRIERCIIWNHAERSNVSFANPEGINYSGSTRLGVCMIKMVKRSESWYSPWLWL